MTYDIFVDIETNGMGIAWTGQPGQIIPYNGAWQCVSNPPQGMKQYYLKCKLEHHPPYSGRVAALSNSSIAAYSQVVLREKDGGHLRDDYGIMLYRYYEGI